MSHRGRALGWGCSGGSGRLHLTPLALCQADQPSAQSPSPPEPQAPQKDSRLEQEGPQPEASRPGGSGAYLQSLEPNRPPLGAGRGQATREPLWGRGHLAVGSLPVDLVQPIPGGPQTPSTGLPGPQPGSAEADSLASPGEHKLPHPVACKVTTSIITPIPSPEFWTLRSAVPTGAAPASPDQSLPHQVPGPARRLSMKMKKLPELRRRLSLRSTGQAEERETGPPRGLGHQSLPPGQQRGDPRADSSS